MDLGREDRSNDDLPEDVHELVRKREEARNAKDYARADALREEILARGFLLKDTPEGAVVEPIIREEPTSRFRIEDPAAIPSTLDQPASLAFSFHLLFEGFPGDVERFLDGLERHNDVSSLEVVIVNNASPDGEQVEAVAEKRPFARALHLDREVGWAAARNAGLKTSKGEITALVDGSTEPVGDVLTPLTAAFADPSAGLAGPFGLVSEDMREWEPSDGPEVDAIEGYLLATRREILAKGLVHEKFKWYRNADIDLSFQIRSTGAKAVVTPLPVIKHAHRGWEALDEAERARRSKKNHYIFFDRWKHHHDLLLSHRPR